MRFNASYHPALRSTWTRFIPRLAGALALALASLPSLATAAPNASQEAEPGRRGAGQREVPPIDRPIDRPRRGLPPDWPRAGGFGPPSDRQAIEGMVLDGIVGGREPGREVAPEELEAAIEVAREIAPEWGEILAARADRNERQLRNVLGAAGRRLLALVALRERAPEVYEAKVEELRAQALVERAAQRVGESLREGADEPTIAAAKAALEEAVAAQVAATLAARRVELEALEARIARFRQQLEEDEAAAGRLAAEVLEAIGSRPPRPRPEGREGPRPDGRE